jgi:eukaryotic-like serine/threonine-protein kinase
MIRCHECDSPVAEHDLFCPFCGVKIATEQVVEAGPDAAATLFFEEVNPDAPTDPGVDNVPTPSILADFSRTHDNVEAEPTSEYSLTSEEIPVVPELDEVSTPEPHQDDMPEPTPDEPSAEEPGIFEERSVYKDPGISKPMQELEESDPHASRSIFDSVRIMEPKPDDVDTRIQMTPGPIPEAPTPAVLSETTNVEPKPYTEPNMGVGGDTDGKRSKLKPLGEGTILNGRYEIVRKIGGGGMGAVYLASDNNLGGVLRAVKEMVQSHIEEEQQDKAINDFKRESMILSTLDHPSIPTIYDYFYDADEGRFYLVMKYISGGDLASRLRSAPEGRIDEKSTTQWAIEITDVLDYLHNQPSTIVYRDLKPSNIMIDGNTGRIMLIDFGIARSISQKEEKGVTAVGTMGYAPPELFSGNVEPRSDIYSLGSTMFHLLTGADPQSNPLLIFDFQKNPRPRQITSQLSDQIERIMMRAVEYNADMRFASAAEMKAVLEEHLACLRSGNVTYGVSAAPASVSLENQSVFCGFCGQRIVATDLFCAFCGAKQPIAQQGVHSEIYARSTTTAKLIIEGTSELTTPAFSLQKDENLVGRRDPMSNIFPEIDLSKYDPQTKISRRHARIWRDGGNFLVEDLGSSNGTILASAVSDSLRLVPHKPHILSSGDKLKVGDTTLHFVVG